MDPRSRLGRSAESVGMREKQHGHGLMLRLDKRPGIGAFAQVPHRRFRACGHAKGKSAARRYAKPRGLKGQPGCRDRRQQLGLRGPMFERFTERARQVVVLAQEEARTLKHNYIGTEHILLGLLREEEGLAARVLESLDITVERVRAQVVRIVRSGEEVTSGQIPFTPRAKKVLELALREALPRAQLHRHRAHPARPRARERGRRRADPAGLRRRLREDPQRGHPQVVGA